MATNIFNYDGTLLTTVQDGTIDTTHASIKFPGRGYLNYGEPVNQNMLWIMQNFANSSAPTNPVTGQLWYDTTTNNLNVYTTGSAWVSAGGAVISTTFSSPETVELILRKTLFKDSSYIENFEWSSNPLLNSFLKFL